MPKAVGTAITLLTNSMTTHIVCFSYRITGGNLAPAYRQARYCVKHHFPFVPFPFEKMRKQSVVIVERTSNAYGVDGDDDR
jgi:hypothetical protein